MGSSLAESKAFSRAWISSRTLPGHLYSVTISQNSGEAPLGGDPEPLAQVVHIKERQFFDVFGNLSQGGGFDRQSPEPKEEIFPESSLPDHVFQVSVGRRHEPEIALDLLTSSDGTEAVLLNDPEESFLDQRTAAPRSRPKKESLRRPA